MRRDSSLDRLPIQQVFLHIWIYINNVGWVSIVKVEFTSAKNTKKHIRISEVDRGEIS